jgi:hypothetical protein
MERWGGSAVLTWDRTASVRSLARRLLAVPTPTVHYAQGPSVQPRANGDRSPQYTKAHHIGIAGVISSRGHNARSRGVSAKLGPWTQSSALPPNHLDALSATAFQCPHTVTGAVISGCIWGTGGSDGFRERLLGSGVAGFLRPEALRPHPVRPPPTSIWLWARAGTAATGPVRARGAVPSDPAHVGRRRVPDGAGRRAPRRCRRPPMSVLRAMPVCGRGPLSGREIPFPKPPLPRPRNEPEWGGNPRTTLCRTEVWPTMRQLGWPEMIPSPSSDR